jgi:hypothetical protein
MRMSKRIIKQPEIGVVYLFFQSGPSYDKEKPIRGLKQILAGMPGHKTIVYVDNSFRGSPYTHRLSADQHSVSGDNRYLEFSGWQKGIDYLRSQGNRPDVWLLANDTLLAQSAIQRFVFGPDAVDCAMMRRAIIGRRQWLSEDAKILGQGEEIMGNALIPYVRTHFFMVASEIIEQLSSIVSLDDSLIDKMFIREFDASIPLFRENAPLSEGTRQIIFSHLTNDWYRRKPYVADHFERLRGKAISILNEILLSLRIDQLGYSLISYTKAGTFLDEKITGAQIRAEWLDGFDPARRLRDARGDQCRANQQVYRRVAQKRRAFTWSNLLDLLESRPGREHM